jgi:hypothetical protein
MKNSIRKLLLNFDGYQTVRSKVMALSNQYSGMERQDFRLTE